MSSSSDPRRALALDALRGISIIMMVLSGRIPFGVLPDWMYHAQVPPPLHIFNPNLPGITWVDLVFPFFLFAMGAAIPLALSRRIEQGVRMWKIVGGIFLRGLLLAAFAIYVMQIRPWGMSDHPDFGIWLFCLIGFLLLFPMLVRMPDQWHPSLRWGIKIGGWTGAVILMSLVRFKDGSGFSLQKSDIIILVLSNVAIAGGLIWLVTRENVLLRLGILAVFLAMRLASKEMGWVQWLWNCSPAPWLFQVRFLQYLFLTIPGTIIGDMVLQWMKTRDDGSQGTGWQPNRYAVLVVLAIALNLVLVIGLKARLVVATGIITIVICIVFYGLVKNAATSTDRLIKSIAQYAFFFLILGMFFEPYEGGIKKDHATISYYFITGGLAMYTLILFTILIDVFKHRKPFALLIETGQNPMIAYAGVNSLVPPILGILHIDTFIEQITASPWLGALRGAFMTYLVALAGSLCTKKKIYLRT